MYYQLDNGESYEDYMYLTLYHRGRFTPEEFLELVREAVRVLKENAALHQRGSHFYPTMDDVANYLEEHNDFKRITPIMGVEVSEGFGSRDPQLSWRE